MYISLLYGGVEMGNQQLSTLTMEERIHWLAVEARLGDGVLWRHPECVNYKIVTTSISVDLLEAKRRICPELFRSGVSPIRTMGKGRFGNAKPMFRLASLVHPIITQVKGYTVVELLGCLSIDLLAMWFLDDGSAVLRNDGRRTNSYRFTLYLGSLGADPRFLPTFSAMLNKLFGYLNPKTFGRFGYNTSRYGNQEANRTWVIPGDIARVLVESARQHNALLYKCPLSFTVGKSSETIP